MENAFIRACKSGDLEDVKTLMPKGAYGQDINNWAVQLASKNGHLEVVMYLVSQGADVQANSKIGLLN